MPDESYTKIYLEDIPFRFVLSGDTLYIVAGNEDRDRWLVQGHIVQGSASQWPPPLERCAEMLEDLWDEGRPGIEATILVLGVELATLLNGVEAVSEAQERASLVLQSNVARVLELVDPEKLEGLSDAFGRSVEESSVRGQRRAKAAWN